MVYAIGYVMAGKNNRLRPSHKLVTIFLTEQEAYEAFIRELELQSFRKKIAIGLPSPTNCPYNGRPIIFVKSPKQPVIIGYRREMRNVTAYLTALCDCDGCRTQYAALPHVQIRE